MKHALIIITLMLMMSCTKKYKPVFEADYKGCHYAGPPSDKSQSEYALRPEKAKDLHHKRYKF